MLFCEGAKRLEVWVLSHVFGESSATKNARVNGLICMCKLTHYWFYCGEEALCLRPYLQK